MDCDEKPGLLRGVADGELHLACAVHVVSTPEEVQARQCGEEKKRALNERGEEVAHMENAFLCLMSR